MGTTYTDRAKLLTDLSVYFNDDLTFWEADSRFFWFYNVANGTAMYQTQTNANLNLVGQIGLGTLELSSVSKQIIMTTKSTINGKAHWLTSTLTQIDNSYTLETYNTFLYETYLANMSKMKNTPAYTKALAVLNTATASDSDIAHVMAKSFWSCKEDVPVVKPTEVTLDIVKIERTADKKPGLEAILTVQGVKVQAQKCKWWLYPGENVIGMKDSATNISGEYVSGVSKFYVDTDLNNRKDWVILNPKNVKVECLVSYKNNDTWSTIFTTKVIDFSELPVYNYFGL